MVSVDKPKGRGKPHGLPPTEAQTTARARNFRVWRLRGIYNQLGILTGERQVAARVAVDEELIAMGAEPEGPRVIKRLLGIYIGDPA